MLILFLVFDIAKKDSISSIVKQWSVIVILICAATGIYYALYKYNLSKIGVSSPDSYNSLNNIGYENTTQILEGIKASYKNLFSFFTSIASGYQSKLCRNFNYLCFAVIAFGAVSYLFKVKKIANKLLLLVLYVVCPFALNFTNFVSKNVLHELMIFSFNLIYIFSFIVLLSSNIKLLEKCFIVLLAFACLHWSIFSNTIMMRKTLEYDKTCAHINRIIQRIEALEGFDYKNDTIYIEQMIKNEYVNNKANSAFYDIGYINGLGSIVSATYDPASFIKFFELSLNAKTLDSSSFERDLKTKLSSENINNMKPYPDSSSVKKFGDVIIVKMDNSKY